MHFKVVNAGKLDLNIGNKRGHAVICSIGERMQVRGHRFRVVEDTLGVSIVGLLQVGINEELVGVDFVCNSSQMLLSAYSEARSEARLELMSSCHIPRRAKMCPGMCRAWAEEGAMAAYFSAAGSPSRASCGLSQV